MAITNTFNYVKFIRGTEKAYAICSKDPDTLYFIYNPDETVGRLYLGDRLIAGSETTSSSISLKDLTDVELANLADKKVLTYDENSSKWVPVDANNLIKTMIGASGAATGSAGLVPAPSAGDQGKFLRADGTWSAITGFATSDELAALQTTVSSKADASAVYSKDEIDQKFNTFTPSGSPSGLNAKVVSSVDEIDIDAEDALSYIYFVLNAEANTTDRYDEYIVLESMGGVRSLEKLGSLSVSLDGYATKDEVQAVSTNISSVSTKVDDLASQLNGQNSTIRALGTKVDDLESLLNEISSKVDGYETSINDHEARISTLEEEIESKVDNSIYETDLTELRNLMSWKTLEEENV